MLKILIVDDELDIKPLYEQRFAREILSQQVDLSFAHSGEEALGGLANSEVGLILSDINMPGMDGLELLRRIRQKYPKQPPAIMMVTAYGDDENYQQAMRAGADDFLTKPLDFKLLKTKLKDLTAHEHQDPGH
ncbi:response regulator [Spirosoma fluviale]|uniref:Response regulator receiver domain-containing protein n=1 Tax=Spirosoma fluviale TaxID=1597977 RepID=A0A286G1W6_9BACT|nr:response regulator [Spirosoma fluviale]SOD89169.1 Response regulator receiver domain-containing protein [Spirosoma fluviale]